MIVIVAKKLGRPISDNSKDYMLRVRFTNEDLEKLDYCCKQAGKDRSKFVRDMVLNDYELRKSNEK